MYKDKFKILRIFVFIGVLVLIIGCAPKKVRMPVNPPSTDAVIHYIDSLSALGFEFKIEFKNPNVKGRSTGISMKNRVKVEGWRKFENAKEPLKAVGIGETEYKWVNGKWETGARTYDTQPIELLKVICGEEKITFSESRNKFFMYKFIPNLLFMDPTLIDNPDKAQGEIWIDNKSLLPVKIFTNTPTSKWSIELKNIGEKFNILSPEAKLWKLTIYAEKNQKEIAQLLKQRLELYGIEGEYKEGTLQFYAENELTEELTQQGKLELYTAGYPKQPVYELKDAHFICEDLTRPVLLKDKITCKLMNCKLSEADNNPSITLKFNGNLPETTKIAVVVDDKVIGLVPQVWVNELQIKCNRATGIKIKLPLPYEVSKIEKQIIK